MGGGGLQALPLSSSSWLPLVPRIDGSHNSNRNHRGRASRSYFQQRRHSSYLLGRIPWLLITEVIPGTTMPPPRAEVVATSLPPTLLFGHRHWTTSPALLPLRQPISTTRICSFSPCILLSNRPCRTSTTTTPIPMAAVLQGKFIRKERIPKDATTRKTMVWQCCQR